jgi:hypothetical protein
MMFVSTTRTLFVSCNTQKHYSCLNGVAGFRLSGRVSRLQIDRGIEGIATIKMIHTS